MSELTPPPTRLRLFLAFTRVGLFGFGGAAALARQVVVEERRWLAERDYAELLPVGQILPGSGPSACPNLTEEHHRRTREAGRPPGATVPRSDTHGNSRAAMEPGTHA